MICVIIVASELHTLGIPDVYIMQRGGWEDDTTLKNVYRHVLVDREKEMNEIGNDYFSKLCNTKCNTKKESAEKQRILGFFLQVQVLPSAFL